MLRFFVLVLCFLSIGFAGQVAAEEEYWEYTFRPGDTIWKVAEKYTTSVNNWSEIQRLNGIAMGPDRRILPGKRIIIPVSMLKQQPIPALVIAVSGDARLIRANGETGEIKVGTKLYSGDRVVTSDRQSLRMQFADKSELQVLSNSEVVLNKLSYHKSTGMVDTRVRLNKGRVNTWVEKLKSDSRYQITTPAAVTAVRGTSFRLSSDASEISRTEVTEGIVAVSAEDVTRQVKDGFGIVAEKGKPLPEPVKLLSAPEISNNLSRTRTTIQLTWAALDGAETYRYQLARDDKFNQVEFDQSTTQTTVKFTDLNAGQFFVRVRGVDQYRLEGLNTVRSYQIKAAPVLNDTFKEVIIPSGILMLGQ